MDYISNGHLIEEREYKTTEARRRATKRFEAYHERIKVTLPLGTQERIQAVSGKKMATFIKEAALEKLEQMEKEASDSIGENDGNDPVL